MFCPFESSIFFSFVLLLDFVGSIDHKRNVSSKGCVSSCQILYNFNIKKSAKFLYQVPVDSKHTIIEG
jgi:hypothetical protein